VELEPIELVELKKKWLFVLKKTLNNFSTLSMTFFSTTGTTREKSKPLSPLNRLFSSLGFATNIVFM
jgi:hypothetical protein